MHSRSCLVEVFRAVQSSRLRAPALISQMLCCEGDMEFYPSSTFMSVLCLKRIHFLICALASRELLEHCKKLETKCTGYAHRHSPDCTTTVTVGESSFIPVTHKLSFIAVDKRQIFLCKLIFVTELVFCCTCRD